MASKKTSAGMALIIAMLKKNPKVDYASIKKAAEKKKVDVYPIMYGRAQALLGIVDSGKRGRGKARKAAARRATRAGKITRRTTRGTLARGADAIDELAASVKETQRENERLRATLKKISDLIDGAL